MRNRLLKKAADKFLPYIDKCVVCGIEKGVGNYLCRRCRNRMNRSAYGQSAAKGMLAYSAYDYEKDARRLVRSFKYHDKRFLAAFLAQEMAKGLDKKYDFVTYVPLHEKRRKQRGYDQAELIAQEISKQASLPLYRALKRVRHTQTQTQLSAAERQENMAGAFESMARVSGKAVLVDDVLTTGATAAECAKVLKDGGADEVFLLTFARATGVKAPRRMWFIQRFFAIL